MNMNIVGLSLVAVLALAIPFSTYAVTQQKGTGTKIQNSKDAVEFFEKELSYKTNPYGTNRAIEEKAKNITIVDVRSAKDYAEGHIPGAINIPYEQHSGFDGAEKEFSELRRDGYNYVYCYKHLCNLGQKAAKKFASLGYPVKEIVGGYNSWVEEGYPVEK